MHELYFDTDVLVLELARWPKGHVETALVQREQHVQRAPHLATDVPACSWLILRMPCEARRQEKWGKPVTKRDKSWKEMCRESGVWVP